MQQGVNNAIVPLFFFCILITSWYRTVHRYGRKQVQVQTVKVAEEV